MNTEASKVHILMVDDSEDFSAAVQGYLSHQGYYVHVMNNGHELMNYLVENKVDLLILDVLMPEKDGLQLAREVRTLYSSQPILMLSSSDTEVDRIVGLEVGADGYLSKSASMRELLAYVRAMLRRSPANEDKDETIVQINAAAQSQAGKDHVLHFGPFELDTAACSLSKQGEAITLTYAEYSLLHVFVTHPNQVLNRERLVALVNEDYRHTPFDRAIDVKVSRLRHKIEDDPSEPRYIKTIRNAGYMFNNRVDTSGC